MGHLSVSIWRSCRWLHRASGHQRAQGTNLLRPCCPWPAPSWGHWLLKEVTCIFLYLKQGDMRTGHPVASRGYGMAIWLLPGSSVGRVAQKKLLTAFEGHGWVGKWPPTFLLYMKGKKKSVICLYLHKRVLGGQRNKQNGYLRDKGGTGTRLRMSYSNKYYKSLYPNSNSCPLC